MSEWVNTIPGWNVCCIKLIVHVARTYRYRLSGGSINRSLADLAHESEYCPCLTTPYPSTYSTSLHSLCLRCPRRCLSPYRGGVLRHSCTNSILSPTVAKSDHPLAHGCGIRRYGGHPKPGATGMFASCLACLQAWHRFQATACPNKWQCHMVSMGHFWTKYIMFNLSNTFSPDKELSKNISRQGLW